MARVIGKLTAVEVGQRGPGIYADGGGLYLHVGATGARSWVFRYMLSGRAREMGLGPVHTIGLAEARRRAGQARQQRLDGVDPIEARRAERQARALDAAKAIGFREAARRYIEANRIEWKNPKHAAQWSRTLESYAYPVFGQVAVGAVDTGLVLRALEPIWTAKPETANRVRGRIESILAWARARGYRDGDNPARWRGHLDQVLPAPAKAKRAKRKRQGKGEHQPAMPFGEVAAFTAALALRNSLSARAIEFAIFTAVRSGEVLRARWSEIDLVNRIWTIPAERMKAEREHRVPLSAAAMRVLEKLGDRRETDAYLFPGSTPRRPLTNILKYLQDDMARPDCTVHGFRSSFRKWAAEVSQFPREVVEMALAHRIANKTEAAYLEGAEMLAKRRRLMEAWARFCDAPGRDADDVVPMRRRA